MSETRGQRVKALFEQAIDLPAEERAAFLQEACGADAALAAEVRSLLEAHDRAEGFLASGQVAHALGELPQVGGDALIGAVIGEYRILGLLGRGGMGAVYRAEQERPRREVALKLIDRSVLTPELLRRFEVEAQVLARLKHPGIAQIHVAGNTGEEHGSLPYFAMELVEGQPITTFAEVRGLDLNERLELVIKVCEAVQHAHQVGVIHRDIKPANILVTREGQPKILDFGVARSTDADLQVTTLAGSRITLIGTLPYMSPEQVRGDPDEIDTRSDVHALGVLCFELLTGTLPREVEGRPLTEAIRRISEDAPRTLAAAAGRRFPTDLETILAKALASEKVQRYDSASALAADLRRFLDGQPINARPPSTIYQIRKLIVRNRLATALLAGLVLLTFAAAVVLAVQVRRTTRERDRANLQATTANEVAVFMESLFLQADPERALGETLTARALLDTGAQRIEHELLEQPAVRGRLLATLAKVYDSLGLNDRAVPLLEEAVRVGRELRATDGGPVDRSNLQLALCYLARQRAAQGRNDEAIELCREAVQVCAATDGPETAYYAMCLNFLAYHLSLSGEYGEAREVNRRGLELRERTLGPDHVDTGWSVYQLAWLLRLTGETDAAREQFERALAIWRKALPEGHPQLATCLIDLAHVLAAQERFSEAVTNAEEGLAIQEKTLGRGHPTLLGTLHDLGYLHWRAGDLPGALERYTDALEAHRAARGPADPGILDRLYQIAFLHEQMGQLDEKEAVLTEAVDLVREHHQGSPQLVAEAVGKLGLLHARQGRYDEARWLLEEAAELLESTGAAGEEDLVKLLSALGLLDEKEGDFEGALARGERLLALRLDHPDWTEPNPLFVRFDMGMLLLRLGRIEEAQTHLRELLDDAGGVFDTNAFFPWNVRWLLAHCLWGLGREDEARELYAEVLEVDPESLLDDLYWLLLRRAEAHAAEGRMEEALGELRAALEAGLDPDAARLALAVDPRLGPDERARLLGALGGL